MSEPTSQDTPTAADVLAGHQLQRRGMAYTCSCGQELPLGVESTAWQADHQLVQLQLARLAVVSVHGTAGVVAAAARVIAALDHASGRSLSGELELLRTKLEALGT